MIQQHHATQAGRFSKCPSCGRQPQHVEHFGRTRLETMDFSIPAHRLRIEAVALTAPWPMIRAVVASISGTGAKVNAAVAI